MVTQMRTKSKIGIKILSLAIVLALVGELNSVISYLTMKEMFDASIAISDDAVTSIRNLEKVRSNLDQLQKKLLLHCIVTDNEKMEDIKFDIYIIKGELSSSVATIENSLTEQRAIDTEGAAYKEIIDAIKTVE